MRVRPDLVVDVHLLAFLIYRHVHQYRYQMLLLEGYHRLFFGHGRPTTPGELMLSPYLVLFSEPLS